MKLAVSLNAPKIILIVPESTAVQVLTPTMECIITQSVPLEDCNSDDFFKQIYFFLLPFGSFAHMRPLILLIQRPNSV